MLLFPLFATVEMVVDNHTHTMFPFEFAIYGFFTAFSFSGAALGMWLRRRSNAAAA